MPQAGWTLGASPRDVIRGLGILAASQSGLLRAGIILQTEWQRVLNTAGGGETYSQEFRLVGGHTVPVGKAARTHTASAPGEAPAPDSGQLKQSIAVVPIARENFLSLPTVRVGTGLRYALALEYGVNVSGSKTGPHPDANFVLQARPHARPALKRARRKMTPGLRAELSFIRAPELTPNEL